MYIYTDYGSNVPIVEYTKHAEDANDPELEMKVKQVCCFSLVSKCLIKVPITDLSRSYYNIIQTLCFYKMYFCPKSVSVGSNWTIYFVNLKHFCYTKLGCE